MRRSYVTTAIDFPNAAPHMGHVMEKVLADVYARWCRLRGDEVRFQIGTDDHGIKIQRTAEAKGLTPRALIDSNIPLFQGLFEQLNISYDCFMSTSVTPGHYATAQGMWNTLLKNGHLQEKTYTALYCAGCEEFKMTRDLEDGVCPNHKVAPEEVSERNWFFNLSEHQEFLRTLIAEQGYITVPKFRAKEIQSFLDQGLEDVSFSRHKSALSWGVPVPNDPDQVMYVWCDNLTNYISTLGYFTPSQDSTWWDGATVTHIVGKDIARFHGLNWPAMLHAAGVKTPDTMLVHGFLTNEGQKMSKSLGNVVQPTEVLAKFNGDPDPIRFYLSHEVTVGRDGDFSWDRFEDLYNSKLRNQLGNLLNRVLTLLNREGGALTDCSKYNIADTWTAYQEHMNTFGFKEALEQVMVLIAEGNTAMETNKPWAQEPADKLKTLTTICEMLRQASLLLLPFIPQTAYRISTQLNVPYAQHMLAKDFVLTAQMQQWGGVEDWQTVGTPEILFAPIEEGL